MKIGVVGDSHKNLEYLRIAGRQLIERGRVEKIIHLGDDYDDADILKQFNVETFRVPGVFSEYYKGQNIANRQVLNINSWRILLTHAPKSHENDLLGDLKPEEIVANHEVDIVLHAHTHIPMVEEREGVLWVNPGHLKKEDKKGFPASFAVINIEKESVKVKIVDLIRNAVLSTYEFKR